MTVVLTCEQIRLELAKAWFADWRLHPNDAGFACYAKVVIEAVDKIVK